MQTNKNCLVTTLSVKRLAKIFKPVEENYENKNPKFLVEQHLNGPPGVEPRVWRHLQFEEKIVILLPRELMGNVLRVD